MTATTPVCPPPATKGAASAVAAPAAPALGAGTRRKVLMQSGAGMLHMFSGSVSLTVHAAESARERSAGATAAGFHPLPVGNHGENLNESQA